MTTAHFEFGAAHFFVLVFVSFSCRRRFAIKSLPLTLLLSVHLNNPYFITAMATCASPSCTNATEAKLACPKCLQLGLKPTYFCSQACFKENYNSHKQIHALAKTILSNSNRTFESSSDGITAALDASIEAKLALPNWARNYSFTGTLRPTRISPRRPVPAHIRKPDYATHPSGVSESEQRDKQGHTFIRVYTEDEIEGEDGLRDVCRMGREVLDVAGRALKPGVTTDEIDRIVHEATIERECYPSPLNYYNFPKSVCTSVNEVVCHGIPDYRELQDGGELCHKIESAIAVPYF
jgi:methionyl aminopeptidase